MFIDSSYTINNFIIKFGVLEKNSRIKTAFHEIAIVFFEGVAKIYIYVYDVMQEIRVY